MAADQPTVVYDHKDSNGKVPSKRKMDALAEKWASERAGSESLVGKKVSLSDLLK